MHTGKTGRIRPYRILPLAQETSFLIEMCLSREISEGARGIHERQQDLFQMLLVTQSKILQSKTTDVTNATVSNHNIAIHP